MRMDESHQPHETDGTKVPVRLAGLEEVSKNHTGAHTPPTIHMHAPQLIPKRKSLWTGSFEAGTSEAPSQCHKRGSARNCQFRHILAIPADISHFLPPSTVVALSAPRDSNTSLPPAFTLDVQDLLISSFSLFDLVS